MQVTRNLSDAWLAHWVTDTTLDNNTNIDNTLDHVVQPLQWKVALNETSGHTTAYYLGIFASLTVTNSVMTLARAFLFAYAGIKAAKFIHEKLLYKVIYVSIILNIFFKLLQTHFCVYFRPNSAFLMSRPLAVF